MKAITWHGSCFETRVFSQYDGARFLKESAEKEIPGTMVRLGTPAIMGGKTALQSSGLSGRGMRYNSIHFTT